jgi:putative ABC transport system permease protein
VVSEIALALLLAIGAGLMITSFIRLYNVDRGLNLKNVLTMQIWLPETAYRKGQAVANFYRQVLQRVEALPGVESASAISFLPLSGWGTNTTFVIEGRPETTLDQAPLTAYTVIGPAYFRTMGIPLLKGRHFTDRDDRGAPKSQSLIKPWLGAFGEMTIPSASGFGSILQTQTTLGEPTLAVPGGPS